MCLCLRLLAQMAKASGWHPQVEGSSPVGDGFLGLGVKKKPLLCSRSPWAGWSDTWAVYPDLAVRGRLGAGPTLGGGGPAKWNGAARSKAGMNRGSGGFLGRVKLVSS